MEQFPAALRAGTPVLDRQDSVPTPTREPSTPLSAVSTVSTNDRLSQLFPRSNAPLRSRPLSTHTNNEPSQRNQHPAPLTPASHAYQIPEAPAPPSFSNQTAYDAGDYFNRQGAQPSFKSSRKGTLLSRLGSLRPSRSRHSKYGVLGDTDTNDSTLKSPKGRLGDLEEDDGDNVDFDISGFEGPIALRNISGKLQRSQRGENTDDDTQDIVHAGLTAEYHDLEARGKPGTLFGGMDTVVTAPFLGGNPETQAPSHQRALSNTTTPSRIEAQREAEKTGEILAVPEIPAVDISNFGGGALDSHQALNPTESGAQGDAKKSYYFPPDPDMPSWRPMSMNWWYITILICIAFGLAGLQEYICQISMRKANENQGLIEFKDPKEIPTIQYFTWKYAPTMILVSYGILWQISDFEVKRLEPYYQLSKKTGATAEESLNMDYLTFFSYLTPIKAIRYQQWAVTLSSLSTLIAGSLVPVLQSASVEMYPKKSERVEGRMKYVRIDPPWSRTVTAALCFVGICGIILLFQLRRKSGLLSDPKGIAGIAAMATRSHILSDFNGLDTANHNKIHKQLKNRRYILHKSSLWQGEYIKHTAADHKSDQKRPENPHPLMLRLKAGVPYIIFLLVFAGFIPICMFVEGANIITEKLPWFLTAVATIIKLIWSTLDCDVRMIEPFYILSRRHASPRTLTLDYTGTVPGWLPIKAAINRHYLVALVGLGAVLTEVLTVCVSSFSVDGKKFISGKGDELDDDESQGDSRDNSGETFKSFWVSFGLALGILLYLFLIACLVYLKRRHKFLPRQPGTIASVLAFIHQSKMLVDFVNTETFNSKQMTQYLERLPKTYALGWFSGRDGEDHCGVDEEEILAEYQHGVDWTKSRLLGGHIGTWEHY